MDVLNIYNELKELNNNPELFNNRARQIIDEELKNCPEEYKEQFERKQWKLEQDLRKFKNPVARMNKMCEIFWHGVFEFKHVLETGQKLHTKKAKVIQLK